ncbi:MAG: hypothetical protein AAF468_20105 [Pseudomonadota bacterium]
MEQVKPSHIDAMALWEAVLDQHERFKDEIENHGTCAMRDSTEAILGSCVSAWQHFHVDNGGTFDAPFDWEWCPWFLANCVDDGLTIKRDWFKIAKKRWSRKITGIDVRPCVEGPDGVISGVNPINAQFWTVYKVDGDGMSQAIADTPDRKSATDLAEAWAHKYEVEITLTTLEAAQ